jgi:hypothetical protein
MTTEKLVATKQLIDATWVLEYEIPEDNINKTRKEIGEPPEMIIKGHYRDDSQYQSYGSRAHRFSLDEKEGRIVTHATITRELEDGTKLKKRYPVRNRKYIFSYPKEGKYNDSKN